MAIEPLGSIMAIQTQSYPHVKEKASSNIQTQANIIQTEVFEKKLTTVVDTNKSEFSNEFNNNNKNNAKNKKVKDDKNLRDYSEEEKAKIKEALNAANKRLFNTKAAFSYHEDSNRIEIKIINKETNEIIKEIPPKEVLEAMVRRKEIFEESGLLFDKRC